MDTAEPRLPYEMEIRVQPSDIDQLGHVNNVVYLRWTQDVAVAHWQALATREQQASLLWVVTRHEIDYKRQAFLQDTILARTWVGQAMRRGFERHTDFHRRSDGKLLAKVVTYWQPVDPETRRATAVGPDVYEKFSA